VPFLQRVFRQPVQSFVKFDIFGSFSGIGSSAEAGRGVLFHRERNSRVWNRREEGDIRFGGFRGGKAVGEGGLVGARIRRRLSRRAGGGLGNGNAKRIFFLVRGGNWLRVDGCGLLPATPGGGIDLRVGGRRGGFLLRCSLRRGGDGETVRNGVCMATFRNRIWPPRLFS
jgi:hypothetical protein